MGKKRDERPEFFGWQSCRILASTLETLSVPYRIKQYLLAKTFRGELVLQDPTDEPANILLERIQKEKSESSLRSKHARQKRR
jgi:hypothetical protein